MAKLILSNVSNLSGGEATAISTINTNSDNIETALENTLSRDGTSPNQMNADLDMNLNDILNVNTLEAVNLSVDGETFDLASVAEDAASAAASAASAAASAEALSFGGSILESIATLPLEQGDVFYATAADTIERLPKGTAAQVLAMNAGATAPEWVGGCLEFTDVTTLLADTILTYSDVTAGQIIRTSAEGYSYEVAASGATDHHVMIGAAGVVKLYIKTNASGEWPVNALGLVDGGDLADIADAVNDYCAAGFAGILRLAPGSYTCSETGLNVVNATLAMDGVTIDASAAVGSFTWDGVVNIAGSVPTVIPDLASDVDEGDLTVTFASAHGLATDDWFLIYNPTDSSYSGFRTYYRAGEYARVKTVTSSTVVELWEPLLDSYAAADVECYETSGFATGKIVGGHVIGPLGTGVNKNIAAHSTLFTIGQELIRVSSYTTGSYACTITSAIAGRDEGCTYVQRSQVAGTGTFYGRAIGNSHDFLSVGCRFEASRHGASVGGGNSWAVPNSKIKTYDFSSVTDQVDGSSAVDFHGNTRNSGYYNGTCAGWDLVGLGGDNNEAVNITGTCGGTAVVINELRGTNFRFENVFARTSVEDTGRGSFLDVGGNSVNAMTADTLSGGTIAVVNCGVKAANQTRYAVVLRNRGATVDWRVEVTGFRNEAPANVADWQTVSVNTVSGDAPTHVQVTDISAIPATLPDLFLGPSDSAVLVRQNPVIASATVTPASTAVYSQTTAVTWKSFAKTPRVATWLESNYVGNHECLTASNTPTKTGANIRVHTTDSTNFTNTTAGTVGYQAALWEW